MEHPTDGWKPNKGSQVLVLAGDITEVDLLCAKSARGQFVRDAFSKWSKQYELVIWVFGNHEYYGESLAHAIPHAKAKLEKNFCDNVVILNNRTIEFGDVIFFGGTAWTDFKNNDPIAMIDVEAGLNDYRTISTYDSYGNYRERRKIRASDIAPLNKAWKLKFAEFCEMQTDKKKVMVTHHAPSFMSVPEMYKHHHLNAAYAFEMGNELAYSDIKFAIHGHIHGANSGYMLGDCQVVSNCRGYFGHELSAIGFKPKQIDV